MRVARCNARARGTARDADSSDLRESGVKSGPRGAWPSSRRRRGPIRWVCRTRHDRVTCGGWSHARGTPGDAAARDAVFIGRAPVPAESFDPQSLCETRSDADRLTIRRRRGHSPPERIWTYPLAPVSAGSRPYCPATKPHVVPGTHRPPLQTSPPVQLFPSEQGAALLVWTQPVAELQVSSVHTFPSSQLSAGPPAHTPPLHASFVVHTLPSSQGAVLFVWTQPVAGLQVSSVHTFPSSQLGDAPPTHLPPLHLSLVVQASPSLHGAVLFLWKQPVAGLQVSSVQTLPSSQLSAGPPTQPPLLQVSLVVQAFPSLQGAVLALWTQPVLGLQVSSVQTLPSSQLGARPPTHTPPPHRSLRVQAFPSSHEAVLFVWTHPVVGLQLSSVQELPSLQFRGVPGWHVPPL